MIKQEELPSSSKKFDCREDVNLWVCKQCGFSSHVLPSLVRHKKAGCGNQVDYSNYVLDCYKCRKCEFISCSCIITTKHETQCLDWTDSMPLLICSHCDFTISYKKINLDKFECGSRECNFTYTKIEELKEHATFVHLPDECLKFLFANDGVDSIEQFCCERCGQELNSKRITTLLICHNCGFKSKHQFGVRQRILNKHLRSLVGDIQYFECQECPYKAKTRANLCSHKLNKHTPTENINWFECQECDYKSKSRSCLHTHQINKHTPNEKMKWFECQECPYKARKNRVLSLHKIRKHTPSESVKWFECEECGFRSKVKCELNRHKMLKHVRKEHIKWFECEECEFKSHVKCELDRHTICKHTSNERIKWFHCEECEFKTKLNSNLKQHKIRKHTPSESVKRFECDGCAYKSKTKRALKIHRIRKHTPSESGR